MRETFFWSLLWITELPLWPESALNTIFCGGSGRTTFYSSCKILFISSLLSWRCSSRSRSRRSTLFYKLIRKKFSYQNGRIWRTLMLSFILLIGYRRGLEHHRRMCRVHAIVKVYWLSIVLLRLLLDYWIVGWDWCYKSIILRLLLCAKISYAFSGHLPAPSLI